jgi:transposase
MKWYLGIDIGKISHVAALMDENGVIAKSPLSFPQTASGWLKFEAYLNKLIDRMDYPSVIVGFEATGHYWTTLYLKLQKMGLTVYVLNPLEVKAFRNEGIRGNKTDAIDAVKIAKLLRFGDFRKVHIPDEQITALRQLTRLKIDLTVMQAQLKQKCLAILDQVFPEYGQLFSEVFGTTSRALLSEASTPEAIIALSTRKLTAILRKASRGRFKEEKARQIQSQAHASIGITFSLDAFELSLDILLSQIDHLENRIEKLRVDIARRVNVLDSTIQSIPGIGPDTAGVILSEVGDFNRLISKDGAEKLVALAGLDPKLKQSGKYQGKTKMSKRGSGYLRHAVRNAAFIAVTVSKDPMFAGIYQKQIDKGKHPEVALSHVSRKMLHVIYSLLKNKTRYKPIISNG